MSILINKKTRMRKVASLTRFLARTAIGLGLLTSGVGVPLAETQDSVEPNVTSSGVLLGGCVPSVQSRKRFDRKMREVGLRQLGAAQIANELKLVREHDVLGTSLKIDDNSISAWQGLEYEYRAGRKFDQPRRFVSVWGKAKANNGKTWTPATFCYVQVDGEGASATGIKGLPPILTIMDSEPPRDYSRTNSYSRFLTGFLDCAVDPKLVGKRDNCSQGRWRRIVIMYSKSFNDQFKGTKP